MQAVTDMMGAVRAVMLRGLQAMAPFEPPPRPPRAKKSDIGAVRGGGKMRQAPLASTPVPYV